MPLEFKSHTFQLAETVHNMYNHILRYPILLYCMHDMLPFYICSLQLKRPLCSLMVKNVSTKQYDEDGFSAEEEL